jgi:hypothetical protein
MLTAIHEGREDALRAVLAAIPVHDGSPFARVRGTHNGRWVVVDTAASPQATRRAGGLDEPLLMCSAVIDRDPQEWLHDLLRVLGPLADDIWSHCPGWPATNGVDAGLTAARVRFLLGHHTPASLDFATWDEPVDGIRAALALRDRIARFAVRTQRLGADDLLGAFRQEFGGEGEDEHP